MIVTTVTAVTVITTTVFLRAAISIKIGVLLICFCSFEFSCSILEKDNFVYYLYIVLPCLIK